MEGGRNGGGGGLEIWRLSELKNSRRLFPPQNLVFTLNYNCQDRVSEEKRRGNDSFSCLVTGAGRWAR